MYSQLFLLNRAPIQFQISNMNFAMTIGRCSQFVGAAALWCFTVLQVGAHPMVKGFELCSRDIARSENLFCGTL